MIPVHLLRGEHCFVLVISIINLCLYVYDSASCHVHTYKTVLDTIKTNSLERNASYYLPRKAIFFRKATGTKSSQSVQSK